MENNDFNVKQRRHMHHIQRIFELSHKFYYQENENCKIENGKWEINENEKCKCNLSKQRLSIPSGGILFAAP